MTDIQLLLTIIFMLWCFIIVLVLLWDRTAQSRDLYKAALNAKNFGVGDADDHK